MNQRRYLAVRVILWVIAVYHLAAGLVATFAKEQTTTLASLMFGIALTMDGQTELLVRYLGAFGIAFGVLAALAALDPVRNKAFIYGAVVYFFVRAFDRIVFAELLAQHHVGPAPNWWRIVVIVAFAALLLWFMPREQTA
jgi:hypothetical protein